MKSNETHLLKSLKESISNVLKKKVVEDTIIDKLLEQIFKKNENEERV